MLSVLSPCKINLFLYILGKRPDGFHNLQSLFCLLDYGDDMSFEAFDDEKGDFSLTPDLGFPVEQNLIFKAVQLLRDFTHKNFSVHVTLNKRIPMGGGLGGGSSNAATTLMMLNYLLKLQIEPQTLQSLGAKLGSDVPFFIGGQNAFVEGRGEILHPVSLDILPYKHFVVVTPECHISTKEIFTDPEMPQYYRAAQDFQTLMKQPFSNDCLSIVRKKFCDIGQILDRLVKYGDAAMSGTGASCFLSFTDHNQALKARDALQQELPTSLKASLFAATALSASPVHQVCCMR